MDNEKIRIRQELRRKAEAVLRNGHRNGSDPFSEADHLRLLHELEVHQIELELQDQELDKIKTEKEKLSRDYENLSDLHTRFILHIIRKGKLN